jgi:hypothetical protein
LREVFGMIAYSRGQFFKFREQLVQEAQALQALVICDGTADAGPPALLRCPHEPPLPTRTT